MKPATAAAFEMFSSSAAQKSLSDCKGCLVKLYIDIFFVIFTIHVVPIEDMSRLQIVKYQTQQKWASAQTEWTSCYVFEAVVMHVRTMIDAIHMLMMTFLLLQHSTSCECSIEIYTYFQQFLR